MNVILAGQKRFGQQALELLLSQRWNVLAVSCPATRSDGSADALKCAVDRYRLPWIPSGMLRASAIPDGTDLIVCAHCHDFIGRATRNRARLGAIGYHPSMLPLHRGRSAVHWAVAMGDRMTGGSVYWLNDTVDGGPVAAQRAVFIRPGVSARDLWRDQLAPLGLELFQEVFTALERGDFPSTAQDPTLATWEPAFENVPPLFRPEVFQLGI